MQKEHQQRHQRWQPEPVARVLLPACLPVTYLQVQYGAHVGPALAKRTVGQASLGRGLWHGMWSGQLGQHVLVQTQCKEAWGNAGGPGERQLQLEQGDMCAGRRPVWCKSQCLLWLLLYVHHSRYLHEMVLMIWLRLVSSSRQSDRCCIAGHVTQHRVAHFVVLCRHT